MMTQEKAIERLNELTANDDNEIAHHVADSTLVQFLKDNGHGDVAEAWLEAKQRVGFWYA